MPTRNRDAVWVAAFVGYVSLVSLLFFKCMSGEVKWIAHAYRSIGFVWPPVTGDVFSTLLAISLLIYAISLFVQGLVWGWPEFKAHDVSSLRLSFLRLLGYGLLAFFAVGLYGMKLQPMPTLSLFDYGLLAVVSIIFGGVVIVINDFLGALYSIFWGGNR